MSANKTDWAVRLTVSLAVVLGGASLSSGQILIDDFNDGNDDGWSRIDNLSPNNGGPSIFDASSGAYNLRSTSPNKNNDDSSIESFWNESTNPIYANGFLRMKIRTEVSGAAVGSQVGSLSDLKQYYFYGNAHSGNFVLGRQDGTEFETFPMLGVTFSRGEDWIIEGGIVGNQLSMKVWRPGDSIPEVPQLIIADPEPLPFEEFGIFAINDGRSSQLSINATFDDIWFTPIPEPSAFILATLSMLGFVAYERYRR